MAKGIDAAVLLRTARERRGLSQRALAELAGTSQSVVARIELGQTSPTVPTLNRLLEATGVSAGSFYTSEVDFGARAAAYFTPRPPPGIVSVYLFGSTARGRRHRESDVDLAVLLDRAAYPLARDRSDLRLRLASELIAALGTNEVDLIVLNDVPPGLARAIVLDGTPIAVFDHALDRAFASYVQLRFADMEPFRRRTAATKRRALARTFLIERLKELRRHLDHLKELRPRVTGADVFESDLSLHNDVLFSLLTVAQVVIDVAGELSAREGHRFEDYTTAVRNLSRLGFPAEVVSDLSLLPGFRNVLVHEYVGIDYNLVVKALDSLDPIEVFLRLALQRLEG